MVSNNEVLHTVSDVQTGRLTHNFSNFLQDLQQQRAQAPQETQQYLAACNAAFQLRGMLPGLVLEGLNQTGDRAVLKTASGAEVTIGADASIRPLQPGELGGTRPNVTPKPTDTTTQLTDSTSRPPDTTPGTPDTTPKPHTAGDAGTTGRGTADKSADTDYTIKQGDSLWRIARKHLGQDASEKDVYALVKAIAKENGMSKINETIYPNNTLKIPGDRSQTTAPQTKPADATVPPPQTKPADTTPRPQTKPAATDSTKPTPGDTQPRQPNSDQTPTPGATPAPADQLPQVPNTKDMGTDRTPDAESQIAAAARKEGIKALNEHMNDIFNLAAVLPNGKFPVGQLTAMLDGPLGHVLDPHTMAMLQNVQSIEKHGNHIEINQKADTRIPLNIDEHGAVIDDVKVGNKISFDLSTDRSGHNQLANVQGISVEGHTTAYKGPFTKMNHSFDAPLQNVTIERDSTGNTVFDAQFKNPEKWYEKLGEKIQGINRGEHIDASIQLSDNGSVTISDPNSNVKRRIA